MVVEELAGVTPKKKAALPEAAKVAINALQEAIDDLGVIPPASSHIPPMTKAVTMDSGATTPIGSASADRKNRAPGSKPSTAP